MINHLLKLTLLLIGIATLAACLRINVQGTPDPQALERLPDKMARVIRDSLPAVRFATYNSSLYNEEAGGLIKRLESNDEGARKIAAVLQRVRPDVVLINEFDYDPAGRAADLFQQRYLQSPQFGGKPIHYPYRYIAPVNTGVQSGLDLDGDGQIGGEDHARGNDAWGYGQHPGQYGMLVLSMYPIDLARIRSFQKLKWSDLPGARQPIDPASGKPWYPEPIWRQLRLSSKSHWDMPILTAQGEIHFLVSHPTPPVFDGPEDRNGARNHDEIRLWAEYLSNTTRHLPRGGQMVERFAPWLCDDQNRRGGLKSDAAFVIAGDLNADPIDGDSVPGTMAQLLDHPRVLNYPAPRSAGAAAQAARYGLPRKGDVATHTGDFGPESGTLRIDYVLPSRNLEVRDSAVFWPSSDSPDAHFSDGSDHHLVWVDVLMRP